VTNCRNDNSWCQKKAAGDFPNVRSANRCIGVVSILQKFLARAATQLQGRSAMSTFARSTNHGRAFVATCVFAAFIWALALSVSPQLHQRVHADASRAEHSCAVTAIASGAYEHAGPPPLVSGPLPAVQFSEIAALTSQWVESLFLKAHIFANAPPARG
jgi:hypothetical protein